MRVARCIGCGCDDHHACLDQHTDEPCSWLVVDRDAGVGVCSKCPQHMPRWNAGQREAKGLPSVLTAAAYSMTVERFQSCCSELLPSSEAECRQLAAVCLQVFQDALFEGESRSSFRGYVVAGTAAFGQMDSCVEVTIRDAARNPVELTRVRVALSA